MSKINYNNAVFLLGAHTLAQCPPDQGVEVAFAGRSNVGKSSVLNAVTGNHRLARTSKTPGRTQQLNFFAVGAGQRLVDLPGYGYARVPEKIKLHWANVMQVYFETRASLMGLMLIMDIRHPLKPYDEQMLEWCINADLPVHVLLNKADKLGRGAGIKTLQILKTRYRGGKFSAQLFSVLNEVGVEEARRKLDEWLVFHGHV
ncbi:MAG: YihA family ribosome biogenesis GTP-binding protein [Gammaproteobacteria bacterium RIFCSPLOWO2_02_FULL_47_50]|nr:MAG: YihA family ribosome biogenesis GTP-binding protein [Gammaproteobacteria bacterium RIFCSPLOWO2_02_47_7]OGT66748.1 MAG: YihA family ribosome biogenesis GTP-binding protein [Gammaproteobacteria bacterium RIFCSPLOWO2_01_FULL_47_190]OGT76083.1 MAG: YihA family ribosome biogenesis GTP-binding protein [Gammaproteobacteria bacterium RIFCSPLOWO2_12_47_11]OGT78942.1 MAG: YihA family ribosome biogenesis GTP-binding protein [Gammaproteobacteria bacterium RIFCSPLOWO2_02_FULL_47_50]OGT83341.1 MAG: Y